MVSVVDAEEVELSDLNSGLIQKKKLKKIFQVIMMNYRFQMKLKK